MFLLHEELPTSIVINKKEYKLDMSFDNILKMYNMLEDMSFSDIEKIDLGIRILFLEIPKVSDDELIQIWKYTFETLFNYDSEKPEVDIKGNPMPANKVKKYMDIEQDAKYIYTSFLQDYNIDLYDQQGKLHWYKFKALLDGLSENTRLQQVIKIRQSEMPRGKGSEKARKAWKQAQDHYRLKGDDD